LAPSGQTGEIQTRINKSDWAVYDETNDWSFDGTKSSFTPWDRVTLYRGGTLIWGQEP
jgi:cellulose 1,4-beta-cellobiosidase